MARANISLSFEFFPPKDAAAEARLWDALLRLAPRAPDFVSVTYGAGGSTRTRTHDCLRRLIGETPLKPAAHLTCVGASRAQVDAVIADYAAIGVKHIVALRGDMPDMGAFRPHAGGYTSSVELVRAIAAAGGFDITVSAYPEPHPESQSVEKDIELMRAKIDGGATRAITQFCFDSAQHLRYRDALAKAKLEIEILPGIMPTDNFSGVLRMSKACGAHVPDWLRTRYDGHEKMTRAARQRIARAVAQEQCEQLIVGGFRHLHFYTLNQADLICDICDALELGAMTR